MRAVLDALHRAEGPLDVTALVSAQGSSTRDALKRLADADVVELDERENRDPLADAPAQGSATPPELNLAQLAALTALTAEHAHGTFVLYGVTGSGKTEVFLGAARHALDRGRQVLVLVPEIGLTPQLVGRFRARFGDDVAVLHSGLTGGERLAQWRRIRAGEASVAVGARSALFAPFQDLGLVVVDEEHDDSYKQDDGVPYSARDLAVVLGREHRCPVVLASATPSLESWHNAAVGRYVRLDLPDRATARAVPDIELVDLTDLEPVNGERPLFAPEVIGALRQTFDAGGKAIVLYNRRGYATMVQCTSCGGTYECPSCGIAMTLHRTARVVACHYCGFKRSYTTQCPSCKKHTLDELGKGTERVEEVLSAFFPDVPIGRMDADTTGVRGAHARILDAFRDGRTRMLVGTQIVAKGHDFPDVHTAVVVSADQGFRMPDFRAAERTYALLVQLAGRAGRGEVAGRVFVQTWKPDHYVLTHLGDLPGFYDRELELRQMLRYPPSARLTLIRMDGVDRKKVASAANALARKLAALREAGDGNEVLGPAPAALPRLVGRWRFQVLLRGRRIGPYRRWLARCADPLWKASAKGVRVSWDVDPRSLM
jgi:primosomal protein N' (replication factor Y)